MLRARRYPVPATVSAYDHLSAMGGIMTSGQLYTLVRGRALNNIGSLRFLRHLRLQIKKKLVIWDGSPIHGKGVTRSTAERHKLRNVTCQSLSQLQHELDLAIVRLQGEPDVIRSSFAGGAGLPI